MIEEIRKKADELYLMILDCHNKMVSPNHKPHLESIANPIEDVQFKLSESLKLMHEVPSKKELRLQKKEIRQEIERLSGLESNFESISEKLKCFCK